jgi:tripartite-type tricarboxylate transporter receptor subunit TctC
MRYTDVLRWNDTSYLRENRQHGHRHCRARRDKDELLSALDTTAAAFSNEGTHMKRSMAVAVAFTLLAASLASAQSQNVPSRPITMVVPVSAGGAMDTVARIVAEGMRASLSQPVIIENVTGASGSIGAGRVARATPDGATMIYGALVTHVVNAAVYQLPYDVLADFEPIALVASTPWLVAAKKDIPADDLRGLIAWLKANPGKASSGTAGPGSPSHIGGILFQNITGTSFQFVPYRGTAPAMADLVAGQIDMAILDPITALPQFRAGSIKVFAAMTSRRTATAPEIPTVDEAGAPGLHISPWQAIWAPKGTPKNVIAKLNGAVVDALADPAIRKKLADQSYEIGPREEQTPEFLRAFHKAEIEKWWPIIKAAGIKAQ